MGGSTQGPERQDAAQVVDSDRMVMFEDQPPAKLSKIEAGNAGATNYMRC